MGSNGYLPSGDLRQFAIEAMAIEIVTVFHENMGKLSHFAIEDGH